MQLAYPGSHALETIVQIRLLKSSLAVFAGVLVASAHGQTTKITPLGARADSRTEDFVRLVRGRALHLPLSGCTMKFDRDAKCVVGC